MIGNYFLAKPIGTTFTSNLFLLLSTCSHKISREMLFIELDFVLIYVLWIQSLIFTLLMLSLEYNLNLKFRGLRSCSCKSIQTSIFWNSGKVLIFQVFYLSKG